MILKSLFILLMAFSTSKSFDLQPKQDDCFWLLQDPEGPQFVFYGGAKGGGKSHLAGEWMYARRLMYPGTHGVIIRATHGEVYKNHALPLMERHPELIACYNKSENVFNLSNGSKIFLQYCQSEQDARSSFWGIQYPDMVLDEGTDHGEDEFRILKLSNRIAPAIRDAHPDFHPRFLIPGNPGGIGHGWCKRLFVDRKYTGREKSSKFGFVQSFLADNYKFDEANPEYRDTLDDLPEDLRQAYLFGKWDVFAGQYFKNFKIIPTVPIQKLGDVILYAGTDWGKRNPASSHVVAVNSNGVHTVCMPIYGSGMLPYELGQAMKLRNDLLRPSLSKTFADASMFNNDQYGRPINANGEMVDYQEGMAHSIADQVESAGVTLTRVSDRDRVMRYSYMQMLMAQGKFQVMDNCVDHIRELTYAVYNTKNTGKAEDVDQACSNHSLDDVGYTCLHTRGLSYPETGKTRTQAAREKMIAKTKQYLGDRGEYGYGEKGHGGV